MVFSRLSSSAVEVANGFTMLISLLMVLSGVKSASPGTLAEPIAVAWFPPCLVPVLSSQTQRLSFTLCNRH